MGRIHLIAECTVDGSALLREIITLWQELGKHYGVNRLICTTIDNDKQIKTFFKSPVYEITYAKINNMKRLLVTSVTFSSADKLIKNLIKKRTRYISQLKATNAEINEIKAESKSFINSFLTLGRD